MSIPRITALLACVLLAAPVLAQTPTPPASRAVAGASDYQAALNYLYGDGVPRNPVEARRRLKLLAAKGNEDAQVALRTLDLPANAKLPGNCFQCSLQSLGRLDAMTLVTRAQSGDAVAQLKAGFQYLSGNQDTGIKADPDQAALWFQRAMVWYRFAAARGDAMSEYVLALMYYRGFGLPANKTLAVELARKSAAQGNGEAMVLLGNAYLYGMGVDKDEAEGLRWLQKSADLGNPVGETALAGHYQLYNTPQYDTKALYLFVMAAHGGLPTATEAVGEIYKDGRIGITPDYAKARQFLEMAYSEGDPHAAVELGYLDQMEKAEKAKAAAEVAAAQAAAQQNADAQAEYQQQLADYSAKVADLRQRADDAEQEAEAAENLAQQAKANGDEAASGNGGIAGIIAVLGSGATQTAAEIDAQKKRQTADDLRQQLRDMGEQAPDPPALRNSIADDAGRDYIGEARDKSLGNINAAANRDAELRAQQDQRDQQAADQRRAQAQRATAAPTVSTNANPSNGPVNAVSASAPAKPKPAKGQGCVEITHLVTMDSKWDDGLGHCDKGVVGWLQNPTSGYANCAWRFNRPGGYGDGGEGTLKPGERTGGEMGGIWSCGALAPDIKYACFAAPSDGSDPVDDNGDRCLSTVKWE